MTKYALVLSQTFTSSRAKIYFVAVSLLYMLLTAIILNYRLFTSFYSTSVSAWEKIAVTPAILIRGLETQTPLMLFFHILIALLFSLNIVLITTKITTAKKPSVKFGLGAGIISLTTAGCATCGLSLLTLVGLGGALTLLPFEGIEILTLTTAILTATLLYNLHILAKACKIDKKR